MSYLPAIGAAYVSIRQHTSAYVRCGSDCRSPEAIAGRLKLATWNRLDEDVVPALVLQDGLKLLVYDLVYATLSYSYMRRFGTCSRPER